MSAMAEMRSIAPGGGVDRDFAVIRGSLFDHFAAGGEGDRVMGFVLRDMVAQHSFRTGGALLPVSSDNVAADGVAEDDRENRPKFTAGRESVDGHLLANGFA